MFLSFLLFFDTGPSNQFHPHSGGVARSHTLPNHHLPMQLVAFLLLLWCGGKD